MDLSELEDNHPSLTAIQGFDPNSIAQTPRLGSLMDFTEAVPIVQRVVEFFNLFPKDLIGRLPHNQMEQLNNYSEGCWKTIQRMLEFDPNKIENPATERTNAISQLGAQFADAVAVLGPSVALLTALQRTTVGAESQVRELLEAARSQLEQMQQLASKTEAESARILGGVRSVAAEAGVSQKATYFGDEAGKHATWAKDWQRYTTLTALGLGGFSLLTWLLGFWIVPTNDYQAVQWAISKVLIFSTIAFMLFLSARTLLAHRHNEIVNRHRQNALLTFKALADAAADEQTKDVVLTHASACIYAPQESGFAKAGAGQSGPSLVEILPRVMAAQHPGTIS